MLVQNELARYQRGMSNLRKMSFLVILVSAIFGLGLGRLLYVGGRWCVGKIHHVRQMGGALPIVPHHSR